MSTSRTRLMRASVLVSAAAACAALTACGGEAGFAETSKQLPDGGPCDLITAADFQHIVGAQDVEVEPDQIQCQYYSDSKGSGANVIRGQDLSKMVTDEEVDLGSVTGVRLSSSDALCGVGVRLNSDGVEQQFAVIGSSVPPQGDKAPCEIADEVARVILDKLPE